LRLSQWLVRNW